MMLLLKSGPIQFFLGVRLEKSVGLNVKARSLPGQPMFLNES